MKRLFTHLWPILALALMARLGPMVFERPIGRDIVEYENLAHNLRHGRGYLLDIKAYWVTPTPVTHYGMYERPLLMPAILATLGRLTGPAAASRLAGPVCFLIALALIHATLFRRVGPRAAATAGLLLALHPALLRLSLGPLSENAALLGMGLIFWAWVGLRPSVVVGMACSMAFLARPQLLLVALILGVFYLAQSIRYRHIKPLIGFVCFASIGPLWLILLNRSMGAPAWTMPQSFLFSSLDFQDCIHYANRNPLYSGALAVLANQAPEVLHRIARHALYYAQALIAPGALGPTIPLLALTAIVLVQTARFQRFALMGLIALIDLAFYVFFWPTFDPGRFLGISYLILLPLVALGVHEAFDSHAPFRIRGKMRSATMVAVLAIAAVWLAMDLGGAYLAIRKWQLGRPMSDVGLEKVWSAPGVDGLMINLKETIRDHPPNKPLPIVASNVPWMIYDKTGLPAMGLPWDLLPEQWMEWIERGDATIVVLHRGDWPTSHLARMDDLASAIEAAGWQLFADRGDLAAWIRPGRKTENSN